MKKLITKKIAASFCLLLALNAFAEDKTLEESNYPKDKDFFKNIGKSYKLDRDNPWLIKKFKRRFNVQSTKSVLTVPNNSCPDYCRDIKEIHRDSIFKIESLIFPQVSKEQPSEDALCKTNIFACYYKLRFDDNSIGYIDVSSFNSASSPYQAVASGHPWILQIQPISPDKNWQSGFKHYKKHFKKRGVSEGYSKQHVLNSQWGKPDTKTKTTIDGSDVEVWLYRGGSLIFIDGYVSEITSVN